MATAPLLAVRDLEVRYGAARALGGITFHVDAGEVVAIIGGNGAGKSTTLRTISGLSDLTKSTNGMIELDGRRIDRLRAHRIARSGVVHVPEGRRIFSYSTVLDNLLLGAHARRDRAAVAADLDSVLERFPILRDRRFGPAGLLSGGEQQMLAVGRALMARPRLLMLDEPSLGLAPVAVQGLFAVIRALAAEGTTILLVEQLARQALRIADRGYVLERGAITMEGTGSALLDDPKVRVAYLGA